MKQLLSKMAFCAMLGLSESAIGIPSSSAFASGYDDKDDDYKSDHDDDDYSSRYKKKCKKGRVWNKKKKKCIKKYSFLEQKFIFETGREFTRVS